MTPDRRHVFQVLARNKGLLERQIAENIEPIGFQRKVENENFYQAAI